MQRSRIYDDCPADLVPLKFVRVTEKNVVVTSVAPHLVQLPVIVSVKHGQAFSCQREIGEWSVPGAADGFSRGPQPSQIKVVIPLDEVRGQRVELQYRTHPTNVAAVQNLLDAVPLHQFQRSPGTAFVVVRVAQDRDPHESLSLHRVYDGRTPALGSR
jgi:hypothetical protein